MLDEIKLKNGIAFHCKSNEITGFVKNELKTKNVLKENSLVKLSISTVYCWMKALGYSYCPRRQNYYVDNHEKKENLMYHKNMIGRYFELERRYYQWVQISAEEKNKLVQ